MTRANLRLYRDLRHSRRILKRKLKEAREKHRPTDRLLFQLRETTTALLKMEIAA